MTATETMLSDKKFYMRGKQRFKMRCVAVKRVLEETV